MPSFRRRVRVRWTIIPFHYENSVSVPIHPVKIVSLQKRAPCFRLMVPISSSRIRYPKKTQKKSVRSPYQDERHPNDQWKSDKLLTLLDGRTRFLSFGFRYENDTWPWMFEPCRWMAYNHFFTGLIHHPPHASSRRKSSLTFLLVLSLYKSFSLWN